MPSIVHSSSSDFRQFAQVTGVGAVGATPLPPRSSTPAAQGAADERKSLCHRFSTVFHRFRPFSGPARIEIHLRNQGSDRFWRLFAPSKNGENGEIGDVPQDEA